jgi:integrase
MYLLLTSTNFLDEETAQPALFDLKIETATDGLTSAYSKSLNKLSKENALTIAHYLTSLKYETHLSDNYRRNLIKILSIFSLSRKNKPFNSMTRKEDVLPFLDSIHKPESVDPMHKWIGTHNTYNATLTRFFKWLYQPDMPAKDRPKPPVVANIAHLKRREISIYKPTDLWTGEDDLIFLKYCPSKRIKCYHTVSRDLSGRPHEILKLKIKDIVFKTSGNSQYAEVLINGKTGSRHIPLINSIPHVKDYLDHEHPQPTNPNAPFICGIGKSLGRAIGERSLFKIYDNYKKKHFPNLVENPNIPPEDKHKIRELLIKPWNPYIRRHTGLTEKSFMLKSHVLNQYAGWSQGSVMSQKYLHYFGNESSESLLEAYGIVNKDKKISDSLRPKQCPNCNEPNKPDSKFCAKCRMVLTYDAYSETLENQKEKDTRIEVLIKKQEQFEQLIQSLIDSGQLRPTMKVS